MNVQQRTQALAAIQDEVLFWMSNWQRAVMFGETNLLQRSELLPPYGMIQNLLGAEEGFPDQRALETVLELAERVRNAALNIMSEIDAGAELSRSEYDRVMMPFWDLVRQLRRLERIFSVASSTIDPLTGLKTRLGMMDEISKELDRCRRGGSPFCIAICDVDNFKRVNDNYGHESGDRVLAAVAAVVGDNIRSFDDAYRMGGEEFLISLKNADRNIGLAVVERLRKTLEETEIKLATGEVLKVTASFGLAQACESLPPGDLTACPYYEVGGIDALLHRADEALYAAKRGGRNRIEIATTMAA